MGVGHERTGVGPLDSFGVAWTVGKLHPVVRGLLFAMGLQWMSQDCLMMYGVFSSLCEYLSVVV